MSDFILYRINAELRVLNIWADVIKPDDVWIFSYLEELDKSKSDLTQPYKYKKWLIVDTKIISKALPILGFKPDSIRKRIAHLSTVGLLNRKSKRINGSNRTLVQISQYYENALIEIGKGLTTEELKVKYFPNGYKNLSKVQIEPPAQSCRSKKEVNGTDMPEESEKKEEKSSGTDKPDNIIDLNINYKGYKDNSYNTIDEPVENSKNGSEKSIREQIEEYGKKFNASFTIVKGVEDTLYRHFQNGIKPQILIDTCKTYLKDKQKVLYLPKVVSLEFIDFLNYKLNMSYKPLCPCCNKPLTKKGHCVNCGFNENMSEKEKDNYIREMKGYYQKVV